MDNEDYKTGGKRIRIKRKFKHDGDFTYFDRNTMRQERISKAELARIGIDLPNRCQKFMLEISEKPRAMTRNETRDILLLLSLSIGPWNGGPKGKFTTVSVEEYANVFYLMMVKALTTNTKSRWDPSRAKWAAYVKWVRLWTCNEIAKTISKMVAMNRVVVENSPNAMIGDDNVDNVIQGTFSGKNGKRNTSEPK